MGWPVIYMQERPGLNEKSFKLFKFRTMNFRRDINNHLIPSFERITRLGGFLRKSSLDELPELINIIKGDMSFVGPRPLLTKYLPFYSEEEKKRHVVKPGLTGLAQINGRNSITWEEKFNYDLWYIDNISISLDVKILLTTILKVIKHEGINSNPSEIAQPFDEYKLSQISHRFLTEDKL